VREVRKLAIVVLTSMFLGGTIAYANERSAALVSSFQSFCTPGTPDFAALDAKATAMNLPVRRDVTGPQTQPGQITHAKSWVITLSSGSLELVATEARGPKGDAASCGIGAEDVDGDDFKQELNKAMPLGAPERQSMTADGTQRLTVWKYADGESLMLADATPIRLPGIYLTLMRKIETNR
jgi:hypothetical protein